MAAQVDASVPHGDAVLHPARLSLPRTSATHLARRVPRRRPAGRVGPAAPRSALSALRAPPSQDLAAASFRADLFADHGFLLWNNQWYSGHYLLSYSVLYPPLGALLGPRLVGALAVAAAAALFALLARRRFGAAALIPSLWFAAGISAWLLTGRIPFLLAVPLRARRAAAERPGPFGRRAPRRRCTSLASPVAGLFLALAGTSLSARRRSAAAGSCLRSAPGSRSSSSTSFPIGGSEPFVFSAFVAVPLAGGGVVWWLVPIRVPRAADRRRPLRRARDRAVLRPERRSAATSPALARCSPGRCSRSSSGRAGAVVVIAVSLPLLYWQLVAPVRDARKAVRRRLRRAAFYEPLLGELRTRAGGRRRRSGSRSRRRRTAGRPTTSPTPTRSRAAGCASSSPTTPTCSTTAALTRPPIAMARRPCGQLTSPSRTPARRSEDEVELIDCRPRLPDPVWSNETGASTGSTAPPRLGARPPGRIGSRSTPPRRRDATRSRSTSPRPGPSTGRRLPARAADGSTVVEARDARDRSGSASRLGFGSGC